MEPEDVMTRNQGWTGETASVALRAWIERIVTEGTAGYFGQQPWQIEAVLDELDRYRAGVAASPSIQEQAERQKDAYERGMAEGYEAGLATSQHIHHDSEMTKSVWSNEISRLLAENESLRAGLAASPSEDRVAALLNLADMASKAYAQKHGPIILEMEALGVALDTYFAALRTTKEGEG